ncbi:hypothetical protein ACAW74_24425 [Fibrella sp. WM1]|uniref:hypothetical protein n=1 Tax=Fibrella musci TaxID=3242485 RepID=UPI003521F3CC
MKSIIYLLLISTLFFSCISKNEELIFEGTCRNNKLELMQVNETRFDADLRYHELKYNDKLVYKIQQYVGLPYYETAYKNARWNYLDTISSIIQFPGNTTPLKISKITIFVNPEKFSIADFETIYQCLKEHLPAIGQKTKNNSTSSMLYQLGAIVYGNAGDFTSIYTDGKQNSIHIFPDGRINHINEDRGIVITSSNGLADNIKEKNKIEIIDSAQITPKQLQLYLNQKTKQPITKDFKIILHQNPKGR